MMVAVSAIYMSQAVFKEIGNLFNVSYDEARHAFDIPMLFYAASFFLLGPLTDRLKATNLAAVGAFGLTATLFLSAHTGNFSLFVAFLSASGLFAAMIPAATFALVPRLSSSSALGTMFGLAISASVIGITIGRSVAGIATSIVGFQFVLECTAGMVFICGCLLLIGNREHDRPIPIKESITDAYKSALKLALSKNVLPYLCIGILLFSGYLGILTFLTLQLSGAPFNASAREIGWISLSGLAAIIGAPLSGWLGARYDTKRVVTLALSLVLLSVIILWLSESLNSVISGVLLLFISVFACQPLLLLMLNNSGPQNRRGMLASLYTVSCLGSGGLASIWLGAIWKHWGWQGVSIMCTSCILASLVIVNFVTKKQN
jgi:YNFM family putative membrane transporter